MKTNKTALKKYRRAGFIKGYALKTLELIDNLKINQNTQNIILVLWQLKGCQPVLILLVARKSVLIYRHTNNIHRYQTPRGLQVDTVVQEVHNLLVNENTNPHRYLNAAKVVRNSPYCVLSLGRLSLNTEQFFERQLKKR